MADQNQSGNKRPPNSLAELGAANMPASISRTLDKVSPEDTQRYQQLTESIGRIQEDKLFQLGQRNPLLLTHPDAAKQYRTMDTRRANYMRQQEIMEEAAAQRANRMVGTNVNQSFSSSTINGMVGQRLETTDAQQDALRIAAQTNPDVLQKRIKRSENRMKRYGEEASNIEAVNKFGERDPEAETRLQQLFGLRELEVQRRTGMTGAARIHRQQGLDPESRMDSLVNLVGKAQGVMQRENPDIRSLGTLSSTDFRKHEIEAASNLAKAFEKLSQVSDSTSDQFKELKKDVDDAEKKFKDVQTARSNGIGGGGGPGGWALAQGGFNAAAMGIQQIGVNQRLGQMGNTAGYAGFQNEIYQTYKAANSGDVASLMALSQFQGAEGFGGGLKTAANAAVTARGLAGIAQMGVGAAESGASLNPLTAAFYSAGNVSALKSGANDLMGGAATTGEAYMDLHRGVSGGQADIAGRQARMAAARALMANGADQLQGFRDFGVGMGGAAMGMGAGGDAFLRSTVNSASLDRLSAARISPEQFAQMSQAGVNMMGSGFNQDQVFGARALERRGLGSMSANLERQSQLFAAGANNPQESFGKILEEAIPKGFDNSKLVGQLVQYSAAAAQAAGGAATGLNMTGAAARLLTSGIGPDTANKEAMIQHAADLQGAFKGVETNVSTSYAGMVSVARTQRTLGQGGVRAVLAESMSTEKLMALRENMNPDALSAAGLGRGTTSAQVEQLITNRQTKVLEAGGAGLIQANQIPGLLARIKSKGAFNKLGDGDKDTVNTIAGLERIQTGTEVQGEDIVKRVLGAGTKAGTGSGAGAFSDKSVGSLQKSMDDLRTQGFVQLSSAASAAAKNLDTLAGAGKGIEALVSAFKEVEKTIGSTEKGAATAAARGAAGGKGFDTTQWDMAAKKLNTILDRIITKQGGSPIPTQKSEMPQ
jgi:hypothetical protein